MVKNKSKKAEKFESLQLKVNFSFKVFLFY